MSYTAGNAMDQTAALLNDVAKTIFTYAVQLPYLRMAVDDMKEILQQHNMPITKETSAVISVDTSMDSIGGGGGDPSLPADFIEPIKLWEADDGDTNFVPMTKVEFLPKGVTLVDSLLVWSWHSEIIEFTGATTNRDVKVDYTASTLPTIANENTVISAIMPVTFLAYRTAALCAEFVGENPTRAQALNGYAQLALDRLLSLGIKGDQNLPVRKRPFRSGYKMRSTV